MHPSSHSWRRTVFAVWEARITRCPYPRATWSRTHSSFRQASTSANPYPFPSSTHPTPHQIFHLPKSTTRADVKARYYDLVRIYHPDSPAARAGGVSPETAHARFQAISAAYAVLTGKKPAASSDDREAGEGFAGKARTSYHDLSTAMWRERQRRKADLDVGLDERWKERVMLGAILLVRTLGDFLSRAISLRCESTCGSADLPLCCRLDRRHVRISNIYHAHAGIGRITTDSPVKHPLSIAGGPATFRRLQASIGGVSTRFYPTRSVIAVVATIAQACHSLASSHHIFAASFDIKFMMILCLFFQACDDSGINYVCSFRDTHTVHGKVTA
ncbi:hypothetical protein LXA43DRAFT_902935 [Ganoderma leucocontextum]|nr:hypothetical protein LXA43DRAFT_902935 [Ganoderma leucocontextum]